MTAWTPSALPATPSAQDAVVRPAARHLLSRLVLTHLVRGLTIAMLAAGLAGCAATMENPAGAAPPPPFTAPVTHAPEHKAPPRDAATQVERDDPLEAYNRRMYAFNARLDRYVFLPVVDLYETVVPQPFRNGIGNVFDNVGEIPTFANCLLQGAFRQERHHAGTLRAQHHLRSSGAVRCRGRCRSLCTGRGLRPDPRGMGRACGTLCHTPRTRPLHGARHGGLRR